MTRMLNNNTNHNDNANDATHTDDDTSTCCYVIQPYVSTAGRLGRVRTPGARRRACTIRTGPC